MDILGKGAAAGVRLFKNLNKNKEVPYGSTISRQAAASNS